jgi:hypothetical protein
MMFRRILTTGIAAVALLTATPALAEQRDRETEPQKVPPCCERMAKQVREHQERLDREEKKETQEQAGPKVAPPVSDDSYAPNSWGG